MVPNYSVSVIVGAGNPCVGGVVFFTNMQEAALGLFASAIVKAAADLLPRGTLHAGEMVQLSLVEAAMGWLDAIVRLAAMEI